MTTEKTYDFIIVGGGASGCVLANRLTANPDVRVLVLEAGGPDSDSRIHDLGGFVALWGSDLDWKLSTEEQPGLGGRRIVINQGKVLGGGSSIHAMMYVRGNRLNYDQWKATGCDGWGYDDVLPYFKKSEDYEGGASEYHGVGGEMAVRPCPDPNAVGLAFRHAAMELGFGGPDWDYNGAKQEDGAGPNQFNVTRAGQRCSASVAFLTPILKRPNLTVETGAEATRVLLEQKRATGIEYRRAGQIQRVHASKEVILSASTFLSPKLLMLSGIGPAAELRAHGIRTVVDLPGVGQNLHDHLQLPVLFKGKVPHPAPTLLAGNVMFTRVRRGGESAAPPDLQILHSPAVPTPLAAAIPVPPPACVFVPILVQPTSRGNVALRSANPDLPPIVDPKYLQTEEDVQVLVSAVELVRELAATQAFADYNAGEVAPGVGADLVAYVRGSASTIWHPVGTCKMGRDSLAVVDPQLRVHGVEALRVVDASIIPTVPSGNTNAACIMIGEKAADMILSA